MLGTDASVLHQQHGAHAREHGACIRREGSGDMCFQRGIARCDIPLRTGEFTRVRSKRNHREKRENQFSS